jgi:hypothetical protein
MHFADKTLTQWRRRAYDLKLEIRPPRVVALRNKAREPSAQSSTPWTPLGAAPLACKAAGTWKSTDGTNTVANDLTWTARTDNQAAPSMERWAISPVIITP